MKFRYNLDKGSKKFNCPRCNKKRFVKYIDVEENIYLPNEYGRCDRESKCNYHLNPYEDGFAKNGKGYDWNPLPIKRQIRKSVPFPIELFNHTLSGYKQNTFIQNLLLNVDFPFEVKDVEQVISLYHLGTIKRGYREGAITFPFIDMDKKIRAVQVKQFDENNNTTATDFLHSIIERHHIRNNKALPTWLSEYNKNDVKVSCLFGEHLLRKYTTNPIALVEAPKSAIYGSLYFGLPESPKDLIWLAVYNLSSLNYEKCKVLKGRNVILFPDLSKDGHAYESWRSKAKDFEKNIKGSTFKVSDLLERLAPIENRNKGNDIADFLIKQDWRLYRTNQKPIVSFEDFAKKNIFEFSHIKVNELKKKIKKEFNISPEDAIKEMLSKRIIADTGQGLYYLNGSTPF